MNKNLEKILLEMFGDPIDSKFGMKIGQLPGIKTFGSVGVRNKETNDALDLVCKSCGIMPIQGKCDCDTSDECPVCGQMPVDLNSSCSCGSTKTSYAKNNVQEQESINTRETINQPSQSSVASDVSEDDEDEDKLKET